MKKLLTHILVIGVSCSLVAQQDTINLEGTVSYVSTSNVYVKFSSTDFIEVGDTLSFEADGVLIPAIVVNNKSSMSCVGEPIGDIEFGVGDEVMFRKSVLIPEEKPRDEEPITDPVARPEEFIGEEVPGEIAGDEEPMFKQNVNGRISAASYSNISDHGNLHRMRYTFSYKGEHLKNSAFSTDNYISFRHTMNEWDEVRDNLGHALKIYALSASYDFNRSTHLTLGRKINHKISSIGAIDGVQFEKGLGNFIVGGVAGSRPDMQDYGINFDLLQAGVYVGLASQPGERYQQSTLAFVEQRNAGNVDRRFVYFQHSNSLMDKLNLFTSFEFDLYENINDEARNTVNLTNLYVSLRYRVSRKFSIYTSYDSRNNIIYYESYKSFIEQLIDDETRQGLRLGLSLRPLKYVTFGANGSWRFQKNSPYDSKNLNTYLNFSKIPLIKAHGSLTANFLQTQYIQSRILGARLSRNVFSEKINADLYFKLVNYRYSNNGFEINQMIAGANISVRLTRKLGLYLYYEATMDEGSNDLSRINTKVIQRF